VARKPEKSKPHDNAKPQRERGRRASEA